MKISAGLLFTAISLWTAFAYGQSTQKEPHVGYLYPAGGRQGSTFQIIAGGQRLAGVKKVYVSGEGVSASFKYKAKWTKLREQGQSALLQRLLNERRAALGIEIADLPNTKKSTIAKPELSKKKIASATETPVLPESELLKNIQNLNPKEIELVEKAYLTPRNKRADAQISEMVLIDVVIDPNAAPGCRELRLETSAGLTNPLSFEVGMLPEIEERESKTPGTQAELPNDKPLDLPILINGQIMPGDVDKFRFNARRGQNLVITVHARSLIPYLADAVPGWFQAVLTLYDSEGNEAAFSDDYRFDPDPVVFYKVPEDGDYEIEIRDSIFRGREDFVYRITVGEQPFITSMSPIGGQTNTRTAAVLDGWNLPKMRIPLNTKPEGDFIRHVSVGKDEYISNEVSYSVDTLPECRESEPNDNVQNAQVIEISTIINGSISTVGDSDIFRFHGRAGDKIVAEVSARRLNSPLDSLLRMTDATGTVLEWNDDFEEKETGLLTHCADSYLCADLPEDGTYYVQLTDSGGHGDKTYSYRLRIGPPRPDFALRATPSSLNMRAGFASVLCVHVLRKDGYDGPIDLVLKDPPAGLRLDGGRVPAGKDSVRVTLTGLTGPLEEPVAVRMEGRALIDGQTVVRPVVPAEDMMQAFIYRHLVPSQHLVVLPTGAKGRRRPIELLDKNPAGLPKDATARITMKIPGSQIPSDITMELLEPPEGITLQNTRVESGILTLDLQTDGSKLETGCADNLIVGVFTESSGQKQTTTTVERKTRISLGVLPAVPFVIVEK